MEIVDLLEYSERAQLREWFEQHAATEKCCWIAMYRGWRNVFRRDKRKAIGQN